MMVGVVYSIFDNKRYANVEKKSIGEAPAEARLLPAMIGAVALPIGMFWFAWTNYPNIHWSVCIAASAPFGFGMVLVFLSAVNYLIDSYTIYAASVLAANSVLRSLFGAAFPLFTNQMYSRLGIHWASSIPAFLALACLPAPFFFYKYGQAIRMKCKYSAQAHQAMMQIRKGAKEKNSGGKDGGGDEAAAVRLSQLPQKMDFAKMQKPGQLSFDFNSPRDRRVPSHDANSGPSGQDTLDQFRHLIMYPESSIYSRVNRKTRSWRRRYLAANIAFHCCLIAEAGIGVSLVAVGALSPSPRAIIALGATSTLVTALLCFAYGVGLVRRQLKRYAAGRQLGLYIEQQERALMLGKWLGEDGGGDGFLREKVSEIEDMYQAVMSDSVFEPVDPRMYKDPVDLKLGASMSVGFRDHQ
jgi:hypothetical protein